MKYGAAVAMAVLGASVGLAEVNGPKVTVCLVDYGQIMVRNQAISIVSSMYAAIGVHVNWQSSSRACKAPEVIHIELTDRTPASLMPGALAYALPYEGVHIRVFYDRVTNMVGSQTLPYLLAHVIVHEIGHILQGIDRHSATGVMKAHWTPADYRTMELERLSFTAEDVNLIQIGLERREGRLLAENAALLASAK